MALTLTRVCVSSCSFNIFREEYSTLSLGLTEFRQKYAPGCNFEVVAVLLIIL